MAEHQLPALQAAGDEAEEVLGGWRFTCNSRWGVCGSLQEQ